MNTARFAILLTPLQVHVSFRPGLAASLDGLEVVLEPHIHEALALENAPGKRVKPIVAENADVAESSEVLVGPRRRHYQGREQQRGVARGIPDHGVGRQDRAPPPTGVDVEQDLLLIMAPAL